MTFSISKRKELQRLIKAFEAEAEKFHELRFSTLFLNQREVDDHERFNKPHHAVMLWQYYGSIAGEDRIQALDKNLQASNLQYGVRGAELSQFGVLEGDSLQLFLRMAVRAGTLFEGSTAKRIKERVTYEIAWDELRRDPKSKPMSVINDNPLAIWLNYLLYHVSCTNPGADRYRRIEPDPFSLSLLALERLEEENEIGKIDRSQCSIDKQHFSVALSFPGEHRTYVAEVVSVLEKELGEDTVFYDHTYQSQLARPNLDNLLQDIYRNRADLIVVFLCTEYQTKPWCGLEWRAVRELMKDSSDNKVMFIRFDDNKVDGVFSIDGYLDARRNKPKAIAHLVLERFFAQVPRRDR
jgi:hypothetical protein